MHVADTIIAISTAAGSSPRAVVRLSGAGALDAVAQRMESDDGWQRTFRATKGTLTLEGEGRLRVPCTVYVMRAPRSYTREDVVELHLPGSPPLLGMALDEMTGDGAVRLARPGEFTQRAFLNGRIDLAQAEAVLAVIRSRSEAELLAAGARLQGRASTECAAIQNELADLRALVEAALDFGTEDIELIGDDELRRRIDNVRERLAAEVETGRGDLAAGGAVRVVMCGPPNAGKSSLLNRLAGEEVALVHHRPGTTRDHVRRDIEVHGVTFALTDTAGLRDGARGPEAQGVQQARRLARSAQLVVLVLDGSRPAAAADLASARLAARERVLCAVNKIDLPAALDESPLGEMAAEVVRVSALTGEGMEELREALGRTVFEGRLDASAADCLFNARQRDSVRRCLSYLDDARGTLREQMGYEFIALDLRQATDALAEVTGEVTGQDVLDRIFSRFCIGK